MELSERLTLALMQRDASSEFFVLCTVRHDGVPRTERKVVTTRVWTRFASAVQARILAASDGHTAAGVGRRTVGVVCAESFHASLVESVCLTLGEPFCVFNPADPARRREALIQRRQPSVLFTDEDVSLLLSHATGAAPGEGVDVDPASLVVATPDTSVAYFIYTSGSTGTPKCVQVSRHNLLTYVTRFAFSPRGLDAGPTAEASQIRTLCLSTPFFDPSIGDMATTLLSSKVEARGRAADAVLLCVLREAVLNGDLPAILLATLPTHVVSTPTVWRTVTPPPPQDRPKLSPHMKLFLGGERMPQGIIDDWADVVALHNIYGVTEATIYQSVSPRILPGTRAAEVYCGSGDAGSLIRLESSGEDGEESEVVLQGPQVCLGYADASHEEQGGFFVAGDGERCFRTGDVAVWVSTKVGPQVHLRGRRDWQVKISGQRASLEEIEQAIQQTCGAAFKECCCCMTPADQHSSGSPASVGFAGVLSLCVCDADRLAEVTESLATALAALLGTCLPAHMIPTRWLFYQEMGGLPQTSTGKVDRNATAQAVSASWRDSRKQEAAPSTREGHAGREEDVLTCVIQQVWCRFFGVSGVTPATNFFHLGGDSLGALKLTRAVLLAVQGGSDRGIDAYGGMPGPFQPRVLFNNPTFGAYVAAVREEMIEAGLDGSATLAASSASSPTVRLTTGSQESSKQKRATEDLSRPNPNESFLDVVATGNVSLVGVLLANGLFDVDGGNTRTRRCATPLHIAVRLPAAWRRSCGDFVRPCVSMTELLLANGAKPTCITADGVTPLHLAAAAVGGDDDDAEPLRTLLSHTATAVRGLHCRDYRQQSLLHFAAREGRAGCVRLLLWDYQSDLCVRDKWQRTPAHWAVLNQHPTVLAVMASYAKEKLGAKRSPPPPPPLPLPPPLSAIAAGESTLHPSGEAKGKRNRFAHLARKKTYLAYETLAELAERISPGDDAIKALVDVLSPIVERE